MLAFSCPTQAAYRCLFYHKFMYLSNAIFFINNFRLLSFALIHVQIQFYWLYIHSLLTVPANLCNDTPTPIPPWIIGYFDSLFPIFIPFIFFLLIWFIKLDYIIYNTLSNYWLNILKVLLYFRRINVWKKTQLHNSIFLDGTNYQI